MATKYESAILKAHALTQQLQGANNIITDRDAEIVKLTKEVASTKATNDSWYRQMNEAKAEVDQAHCLLDALPAAPARKGASNEYGHTPTFGLMTRLAAWMAVRA